MVLSGLGGMGKTELALKFGREHWLGRAYFVRWQGNWFRTAVYAVADGVPGVTRQGCPEQEVYRQVMERLRQCTGRELLILDNADEGSMESLLRELSPLPLRVLVTTRQEPEDAMRLGRLSEEALFALFRRHGAELSEGEMRELIAAVDGHTMAVDLMARLLRRERRRDTLTRLKQALTDRDLNALEFGRTDAAYPMSPEQARINEHLKAVFRVSELTRAEQTVLRLATLLGESGLDSEMFAIAAEPEMKPAPPEPVKRRWFEIFRRKPEEKPQPVPKIRDVLQELADKGWLLWERDDLGIHPVIRLVCIEVLKPSEENCGAFLHGVSNQYDPKQYDHVRFRQMAELFENAANTLEDKTGHWANQAGYFWGEVAENQRALACYLRSVKKKEKHQPDSSGLATGYNNVGYTYGELGDHEKALEYKQKALAIRERVLPPDHPDLAQSYNNVGSTYGALGDHEQALEYKQKALAIWERVLPPDHPHLATSYNNVGYTYGDLGDHEKALEYKLKALAIQEKILPDNHPWNAACCNNIACTYYDLGRLEEAAEYMRRAAQIINRATLPENHPHRVNINKWADELEEEARRSRDGA